jgi:hypothetical protein
VPTSNTNVETIAGARASTHHSASSSATVRNFTALR